MLATLAQGVLLWVSDDLRFDKGFGLDNSTGSAAGISLRRDRGVQWEERTLSARPLAGRGAAGELVREDSEDEILLDWIFTGRLCRRGVGFFSGAMFALLALFLAGRCSK